VLAAARRAQSPRNLPSQDMQQHSSSGFLGAKNELCSIPDLRSRGLAGGLLPARANWPAGPHAIWQRLRSPLLARRRDGNAPWSKQFHSLRVHDGGTGCCREAVRGFLPRLLVPFRRNPQSARRHGARDAYSRRQRRGRSARGRVHRIMPSRGGKFERRGGMGIAGAGGNTQSCGGRQL